MSVVVPKTLNVTHSDLWLKTTLQCGQSFRWKEISDNKWRGVIGPHVVTLHQFDETQIQIWSYPENPNIDSVLSDYFQLSYNLPELTEIWKNNNSDTKNPSNIKLTRDFTKIAPSLKGLRLLQQDPWECLFSFLSSQNNNIKRICLMISRLCERYGTKIGNLDGEDYFCFPNLEQLEIASESDLRDIGFGYRAKYLVSTVQQIKSKGGKQWLESLCNIGKEVQHELVQLDGIGPKVAACIALFSLKHFDIVPVDTHVFQIAQRYLKHLKGQKLNKSYHAEISSFFQTSFGDFAGWAHTIMFAAELPVFKPLLKNISHQSKKKSDHVKKGKENRDNEKEPTIIKRKPEQKPMSLHKRRKINHSS